MKAYQVQFILPVDNPEDNVTRENKGQVVHFSVPCNLPELGQAGYERLCELAKDLGSNPPRSTRHNKSEKAKE